MNQILKLALSDSEYLSFEIGYPFDEMRKWDGAALFFKINKDGHLLSDSSMFWDLTCLIEGLEKALNNKLQVYPSIQKNLGYLWNEKFNKNTKEIFEYRVIEERQRYWVGKDYILWETPGNARPELTTWLYNSEQGEIVMEVTPNYPRHFRDPDSDEKFYSYEEFMKNYKPLLTRILPSQVARAWIQQSENMLKMIENEAAEG